MVKAIVVSTINAPSKAIRLFDAMPDWHLIVVGDVKTPSDYKLERGTYLSPIDQDKYDHKLSRAIGWNVFQRANIGLLLAYEMGAEVIALVNDDNVPYSWWGQKLMLGKKVAVNYYETDLPAFDPMGATQYKHLWHRGYPLQLLSKRDYSRRSTKIINADVQADFWNGDPDVDAICRLEHAPICTFGSPDFPIASNKPSPFNCQNTFILRNVVPDYYLSTGIGRMDDIWASYYAQSKGHRVVYGAPSVYHDRDPHDLIVDMKNEYLGYEYNLDIVHDIHNPAYVRDYISKKNPEAFRLYKRHFA